MKYIKLYESFETDLEDILLEITDIGYNIMYTELGIQISKLKGRENYPIDFEEIKDCLLRLKDYLGYRYKDVTFEYFTHRSGTIKGRIYGNWRKFDLKENSYFDFKVLSFHIEYKNKI